MGGGGRGEGCTGGEGRAMCCMGTSPAGPPALMRLPMLTLARAFANNPGSNGLALTPAALMTAIIPPSMAYRFGSG